MPILKYMPKQKINSVDRNFELRKAKESLLSQNELKRLFHYDKNTGLFTRLVRVSNNAGVGDIAGCLSVSDGYIGIYINKIQYRAHRLAWLYVTGKWPENEIDHNDHIRHNNKWKNLSPATKCKNSKNSTLRSDNSSGITGVCLVKKTNRWHSYINLTKGQLNLGYFTDFFEACCARKSASNKYGFHENHGLKK